MIEFRIGWSASSNVSFHGHTDWTEWDGLDSDVESALCNGTLTIEGLEQALEASGFDWWIETRGEPEQLR